jgi:hypothetical protein
MQILETITWTSCTCSTGIYTGHRLHSPSHQKPYPHIPKPKTIQMRLTDTSSPYPCRSWLRKSSMAHQPSLSLSLIAHAVPPNGSMYIAPNLTIRYPKQTFPNSHDKQKKPHLDFDSQPFVRIDPALPSQARGRTLHRSPAPALSLSRIHLDPFCAMLADPRNRGELTVGPALRHSLARRAAVAN